MAAGRLPIAKAIRIGLGESFRASWWIVLTGIVMLAGAWTLAPDLFWWLTPIAVPQILAPLLISFSSSPESGRIAARCGLFRTVEETTRPPVMIERDRIIARWLEPDASVFVKEETDEPKTGEAEPAYSAM
uniref:CAZy families GT2 protein n=1 Tax=uncultured Hirschia sp. TaxID=543125 RepID=A0A060CF25_9PROT|nr:CAZy families GT2 protein [uncultured Hirschia sp.]